MTRAQLAGRRVLLVEDEALIALDMDEALRAAGVTVIGPISSLAAGNAIAGEVAVDAALLDINLAREPVWPMAEVLARRGVPILFLTGYGSLELPASLAACARLEKPVSHDILLSRLAKLLATPAG
jgi:DNA-binding response OmpR family regulator